jgi:glucose/arabinose dehydrogenase
LLLCLLFLPLCAAQAQNYRSEEHDFRVVKVVEGLEQPWCVAFLPDGRLLVTEKAGRLRVVQNGKLDPAPVGGMPQVTVHGQGGFFDVAPHPDFARNSLLYLSYAARGDDGVGTELARGRLAIGWRTCRSCSARAPRAIAASTSAAASSSTARDTST